MRFYPCVPTRRVGGRKGLRLASLFASDLLLKPPKELVSLAIACISALYFTATLIVGLKERKKGAVAASAVCVIITIASFFI